MNVIVVDTSSWIEYFKGRSNDDLELALQEGRVYLPPLVVTELMSAKMKSTERQKLSEFLAELPICDSSFSHWKKTGEMRSELLSKGFTISTPDAHIAQCALDLNGYLLSEDRIFKKFPKIFNLKVLQ